LRKSHPKPPKNAFKKTAPEPQKSQKTAENEQKNSDCWFSGEILKRGFAVETRKNSIANAEFGALKCFRFCDFLGVLGVFDGFWVFWGVF
jgi:hypothetical protein